jgi:hypothetical protein
MGTLFVVVKDDISAPRVRNEAGLATTFFSSRDLAETYAQRSKQGYARSHCLRTGREGNFYIAHYDDFQNLQESRSEYGDTPMDALTNLLLSRETA